MTSRALWLLSPLFAIACSSNPGVRTCRTSASCAEGDACYVGTCANATVAAPVQPASHRLLLEPDDLAFVFDDDQGPGARVSAPLGASIGTRARLLLRFPKPDLAGVTVQKAWLVLDRVDGALAGPGDVKLRVMKIVEPWSIEGGAGTTWAGPPQGETLVELPVAARGAGPIRIDVTAWVASFPQKGPRPWGLRVEGKGDGYGLPIATGAGGGRPRLEVFVQ